MKLEQLEDSTRVLLEDVVVTVDNHIITAITGFNFDGASIPKPFWSIIGSPYTGKYQVAALIHDLLYATEYFDRKTCDDIFLFLMKEYGVGYLKRYAMYWAVRAGGRFVWNKHKPEDVNIARMYIDVKEINC